jgi:thiamine-phosphate pyrophosphorylase
LHAILDVDVAAGAGWPLPDLLDALLDGGAPLIQVRAKHLASGPLLELCELVVERAGSRGTAVIVNDRADLARLSAADGVHVGQDDLAPADARAIVGPDRIVGCSTHTVAQIDAAAAAPVDYIAIGPVFGTRTKDTGYHPIGVAFVAEAVRRAHGRPIVAIGGITLGTVQTVISAGAAGVAVISDLLVDRNPAARVRAYLQAIRQV